MSPVLSSATLHCSLPIHTDNHIGFVDFPSGRYREDPSGPAGGSPNNRFGVFYAPAAHKWVRTENLFGAQYLSPDGKYLAQLDSGPIASGPSGPRRQGFTDVYLLDLTNLDRHHAGVIPGAARLIAFRPEGLYVEAFGADSNGRAIQPGIYRFDLKTGTTTRIGPYGQSSPATDGIWFHITSAGAWRSLAAVPNQNGANEVQAMSLSDGKVTTWYTAPSQRTASIVGFVQPNEPLVAEFDTWELPPLEPPSGLQFLVLTAAGSAHHVDIEPSTSVWVLTDAMGIWLAGPGRLSLYDSAGLILMADLSMTALATETPFIAGRCS